MLMPPVSRYMTAHPFSVAPSASVASALAAMRDHAFHHLPVVERGAIVGIVCERDLHMLEAVAHVDPHTTCVREAMVRRVLTVSPETPLDDVADLMASRQCGSVVVTAGDDLVGIFTATDALAALSDVLDRVAG